MTEKFQVTQSKVYSFVANRFVDSDVKVVRAKVLFELFKQHHPEETLNIATFGKILRRFFRQTNRRGNSYYFLKTKTHT